MFSRQISSCSHAKQRTGWPVPVSKVFQNVQEEFHADKAYETRLWGHATLQMSIPKLWLRSSQKLLHQRPRLQETLEHRQQHCYILLCEYCIAI